MKNKIDHNDVENPKSLAFNKWLLSNKKTQLEIYENLLKIEKEKKCIVDFEKEIKILKEIVSFLENKIKEIEEEIKNEKITNND